MTDVLMFPGFVEARAFIVLEDTLMTSLPALL